MIRTCYLLATFDSAQFAGASGMETMSLSPNHNTLPPALQPVWCVVEQTSETGPDYGHISEQMIAGGLTLVEATQRLSHLLKTVATPAPFSAVRLGNDGDTCLIIHTCTALRACPQPQASGAARRKCHRHHPEE